MTDSNNNRRKLKQKRTVTFVIRFDDNNIPRFLWDAHLVPVEGFEVLAIAEGNAVKELEEFETREFEE